MKNIVSILGDFCNLIFPKPEGESWSGKEIALVLIFLAVILYVLAIVM